MNGVAAMLEADEEACVEVCLSEAVMHGRRPLTLVQSPPFGEADSWRFRFVLTKTTPGSIAADPSRRCIPEVYLVAHPNRLDAEVAGRAHARRATPLRRADCLEWMRPAVTYDTSVSHARTVAELSMLIVFAGRL